MRRPLLGIALGLLALAAWSAGPTALLKAGSGQVQVDLSQTLAPNVSQQKERNELAMTVEYPSGKVLAQPADNAVRIVLAPALAPTLTRAEDVVQNALRQKPSLPTPGRPWFESRARGGALVYREIVSGARERTITTSRSEVDAELLAVEDEGSGRLAAYRRYKDHVQAMYQFPDKLAPEQVDAFVLKFLDRNVKVTARK